MLFLLLVFVLLIGSTRASQSLQPTIYTNHTRILPSGATVTRCATNCYRDQIGVGHISWSKVAIATTIVAETHVLVINNRINTTRTSTTYNMDINRGDYHIAETNSAGTAIATVLRNDGNTNSYKIIAYPTTAYNDYESSYSLCGTLPTVTGGSTTCLAYRNCAFTETPFRSLTAVPSLNTNAPSFTFPSHPPLPEGIPPGLNTIQDPKGLTYVPKVSEECDDSDVIRNLFPSLGLWSCKALNMDVRQCTNQTGANPFMIQGNIALSAAVYLTTTSTSIEADETTPGSKPTLSPVPPPLHLPTATIPTLTTPNVLISHSRISALPDLEANPPPATSVSDNVADSDPLRFAPIPAKNNLLDGALAQPEVLPSSSTTFVPVAVPSTGAQGNVATMSNFVSAVAVLVTSLDANGKSVVSTSLSTIPTIASPPPAKLVPVVVSSPDSQGIVAVSTSYAAAIAVPTTFMNAQGENVVSTSLSTAPVTASIPNIILTINAQGVFVSSLSQVPAIVLTTTDALGSKIVTTSPLLTIPVTTAFAPQMTAPPALTIGGQTITANSMNGYTIGSQTLTPGGIITASGTRISLSPDGKEAVLGSVLGTSTQELAPHAIPTITSPPFLTIGSQRMMPNAQGQYIVGSQTLTPGGVITLSGTRVSLASNGAFAVVGSSTEYLAITSPPALTIGSQTITPNAQDQYIIGSQTLTPGGAITVSGTRISLVSNGADAVIGTSTEWLGGYNPGKLGDAASGNAPGAGLQASTGGAQSVQRGLWVEAVLLFMGLALVMWL